MRFSLRFDTQRTQDLSLKYGDRSAAFFWLVLLFLIGGLFGTVDGQSSSKGVRSLKPGDLIAVDAGAFGGSGGVFWVDAVTGEREVISSSGEFVEPTGVAWDHQGKILVADRNAFGGGGGVLAVDPQTGVQTLVSFGGGFVDPIGIVVDPSGTIYVADANAYGASGGIIKVNRNTGDQTKVSSGGYFVDPIGMVMDSDGSLLVADQTAFASVGVDTGGIIRVNPATGEQTVVCSGGNFHEPTGIAIDPKGEIFISDPLAIGGGGAVFKECDSVISSRGIFDRPYGIAIGDDGTIWIANAPIWGGTGEAGIVRLNSTTGDQIAHSIGGDFVDVRAVTVVPSQFEVIVPGTSNPWLAGMSAGQTANSGDAVPYQSPVEIMEVPIQVGYEIEFSASGAVNNGTGVSLDEPDGNIGNQTQNHSGGAENGISDVITPIGALVGVFLGGEVPDLSSAPSRLDFSGAESRDYVRLLPALKQVFFIGDGLTGNGTAQRVVVPVGATRLFLGTMDENTWSDNQGFFTVNGRVIESISVSISSIDISSDGDVRFVISGPVGLKYIVQYVGDLSQDNWKTLSTFLSQEETTSVEHIPEPPTGQGYYRVKLAE